MVLQATPTKDDYRENLMMRIYTDGCDERFYDKDYENPRYRNEKLCAECGGLCCKHCGCFLSPDDFGNRDEITINVLKREIQKGYITLELVDLDQFYIRNGFAYVVRVRNAGSPIVETSVYRPSSPCILLGENGCKLDWEHRPSGGKLLAPKMSSDGALHCHSDYDARMTINEWMKYQGILHELSSFYSDANIPCSI